MVSLIDAAVARIIDQMESPEMAGLADISAAWRKAVLDGRTSGQLPDHQPKLVGLGIRDEKPPLCPTEPIPYNPPVRADRKYLCLVDSRVKVRMRSDGLIVKTRYSCNWCGPCLRWWRYCKRHKYEWGTSGKPEQTIVIVSGLADDDVASAVITSIGRAGKGPRFVSLVRNPRTYHWDALVVFANPQPANVCRNIERGRERAGQECTIETRLVNGAEIEATWLPENKKTAGNHDPCRFVSWGTTADKGTEYQYGDGYVTEDALAPEDAPFEHQAPADPELAMLKMTAIDTNSNRRAKLKARNRVSISGASWTVWSLTPMRCWRLRTAQVGRDKSGDWFGCIAFWNLRRAEETNH